MANWLNQFGTNLGNMLIQQQDPFGSLAPQSMTPEQWRSGVARGLMGLAGGIGQASAQGQAPLGALGSAFNQIGQQGQERGLRQLQVRQLQSELSETERAGRVREQLTRQLFPDMASAGGAPAASPAPSMPMPGPQQQQQPATRSAGMQPAGAGMPSQEDIGLGERFGWENVERLKGQVPQTHTIPEVIKALYAGDPNRIMRETSALPSTFRNMNLHELRQRYAQPQAGGAQPAAAAPAADNTARLQQLRKALFIAPADMRPGIQAEIEALSQRPGTRTVTTKEGVFDYDPATGQMKKLGDPTEREGQDFKQEQVLREEWIKQNNEFTKARDAYGNILASSVDDTGASDVALIFSFIKMLDPSSTVTQGEAAGAQNTTGVEQSVINLYNKALKGTFLSPDQRANFVQQSARRYESSLNRYEKARETSIGLAKKYPGVDPSRVVIDLTAGVQRPVLKQNAEPQRNKFKDASSIPEGVTVTDDDTGQKLIKRGGQLVPVQ